MNEQVERFWALCRKVNAHCQNAYAQAYAKAGLSLTSLDAIKQQAPYILGNLQHWRGPIAKEVRAGLREFVR